MFGSMLPSDNLVQPVSLNLIVPYLDYIFAEVNTEHVSALLEVAFSSILKRHSHPAINLREISESRTTIEGLNIFNDEMDPKTKEFIYSCDDYESLERDTVILGIVEYEVEIGLFKEEENDKRISFYDDVVEQAINHLTEELITNPVDEMEEQLSILLSCFEKYERINIRTFRYDTESHRLWLVITG